MHLFLSTNRIKLVLIVLLIVLGAGSYLYNLYLIEKIREQESSGVELWAKAIEFNSQPIHEQVGTRLSRAVRILSTIPEVPDSVIQIIEDAEVSQSTFDFVTENLILGDRFRVPSVVVDANGEILFAKFISENDLGPSVVQELAALHDPIEITIGDERVRQSQYVYYGESQTVQYLRFFPYFQFGLLALLLGIGYTTYRTITRSEQSNLWVGMAKEAAHQLGTPISSLFGWVQLLKDRDPEGKESPIIREIENDVNRLRGIAERFNKIGSKPTLKVMDLEPIIDQITEYMESRLPQIGRKVEVKRKILASPRVEINPELFNWALENLIKNALDAIRKQSDRSSVVAIIIDQLEDEVYIDIQDSGHGIEKRYLNEIFKPGFSTKKRGWGLGLSLTRRIIVEYHKGKLEVLRSDPEEGTTMRITLKTAV
ncbi:MAG: HAMP domain-containing sensor histidine kinase [Balneolaceae bacterium]